MFHVFFFSFIPLITESHRWVDKLLDFVAWPRDVWRVMWPFPAVVSSWKVTHTQSYTVSNTHTHTHTHTRPYSLREACTQRNLMRRRGWLTLLFVLLRLRGSPAPRGHARDLVHILHLLTVRSSCACRLLFTVCTQFSFVTWIIDLFPFYI